MWAPREGTSSGRSWSSKLLWELRLRRHRSLPAQPGAAPVRMHDGLAVLRQTCPWQWPPV